ncbi:trimeric intracellular cation channel family protein, partial [Salmonella enterica]|uniref:trimeric intracellular cation channel family protein n=2 Tax=Pseudomonadota TaxID=1224 RepID=UPI0020C402D1
IWVTPERWWRDSALAWFDAVGLAAYAVYGAAKAIGYGIPPIPAAVMGVVTACVGGIIRDVLAGEPSILMRPELYVTAAA